MRDETTIGIFYASTTGNTEDVVAQIAADLTRKGLPFVLHDIASEGVEAMNHHARMIMGISTWDFGQLQEDWQMSWSALESLDFSGCKVALFGLGDQVGYGEWFVDAMADLNALLLSRGAEIQVPWPVEGYSFEASRALTEDGRFFVGLALDEDGQSGETEARLQLWLPQVCKALLNH